jgi:hypothetical protein
MLKEEKEDDDDEDDFCTPISMCQMMQFANSVVLRLRRMTKKY